jgi:uncharacterized phage protein (TIGR01671 family)
MKLPKKTRKRQRRQKMREILFRGKRKDTNEWVYGFLHKMDGYGTGYTEYGIQVQDTSTSRPWSVLVIPETVGQYTGLADRNGKKIFEGDICLCDRNINDHIDNRAFIITFDALNGWYGESKDGWSEFSGSSFECAEVIGNTHDTPELLER